MDLMVLERPVVRGTPQPVVLRAREDTVSSMSESEDVEMTRAGQGGPPIGGAPGGSSSGVGHQEESPTTIPTAPPKALVTKEMMTPQGSLSAGSCNTSWEPVDFWSADAQGGD